MAAIGQSPTTTPRPAYGSTGDGYAVSSECNRAHHGRCDGCGCRCHKASQRWRGLRRTGKELTTGDAEPGPPIRINCHRHTDHPGICDDCAADLALILADIPALLDELDTAIAGATKFVEHGTRSSDDPGDGVGGHPAVIAQQRIRQALAPAADWFDSRDPGRLADQLAACLPLLQHEPALTGLAAKLSAAAARAHWVIDRPRDRWFYGPCPECGNTIWQDRVDADDPAATVRCNIGSCHYRAQVADHYRLQLNAGRARWLTVAELLPAFELAGTPLTRDQMNGLIHREGLARQPRARVRWDAAAGALVPIGEVWTYRVGDVIDMLKSRGIG